MVFDTNQCGKIFDPIIQNIILPQIGLAQEYLCCVLILCTDTVYWYCVLILCTDTVYLYCVLILCTDTVYWYCVLILCTDTVYCYCVLLLCTDTVYCTETVRCDSDKNCQIKIWLKNVIWKRFGVMSCDGFWYQPMWQNLWSHDPKYYTTSDWLGPRILMLCIDTVYWYCVLVALCTGTVYW